MRDFEVGDTVKIVKELGVIPFNNGDIATVLEYRDHIQLARFELDGKEVILPYDRFQLIKK